MRLNDQDKQILDTLIQDKGVKYAVVVDNDSVWVEDKEKHECIHDFREYGYHLLLQVFVYLGLDADYC